MRCTASSSPSRMKKLLVAHILRKDKSQTALLDDLQRQLEGGASKSFAELAKEFSECGSAKREGQLGWLSPGTYFPEFEQAAFAAPVGGLARASTPMGIHLIKILDMRCVGMGVLEGRSWSASCCCGSCGLRSCSASRSIVCQSLPLRTAMLPSNDSLACQGGGGGAADVGAGAGGGAVEPRAGELGQARGQS